MHLKRHSRCLSLPAASRRPHLPLDYGILPLSLSLSFLSGPPFLAASRRGGNRSFLRYKRAIAFVCPAVSLMEPFLGISRSALGTHACSFCAARHRARSHQVSPLDSPLFIPAQTLPRTFVTSAILRTMSDALSSVDPVCAHVTTAIPDLVHLTMALIRKFLPLPRSSFNTPLHRSFSHHAIGTAFIAPRQSVGALRLEV